MKEENGEKIDLAGGGGAQGDQMKLLTVCAALLAPSGIAAPLDHLAAVGAALLHFEVEVAEQPDAYAAARAYASPRSDGVDLPILNLSLSGAADGNEILPDASLPERLQRHGHVLSFDDRPSAIIERGDRGDVDPKMLHAVASVPDAHAEVPHAPGLKEALPVTPLGDRLQTGPANEKAPRTQTGATERYQSGDVALRAFQNCPDRCDHAVHEAMVRRLKLLKFAIEVLGCVMTLFLTFMLLMFSDWLERADLKRTAVRFAWAALVIFEVGTIGIVGFVSVILAAA